jgi:hypothetical protein
MSETTPLQFESCDDVMNFLCAQFGEDDDSERCQAVKRHLAHCSDCSQYCDSLEKMIGLYRTAAPEFPSDARDQLLRAMGVSPED